MTILDFTKTERLSDTDRCLASSAFLKIGMPHTRSYAISSDMQRMLQSLHLLIPSTRWYTHQSAGRCTYIRDILDVIQHLPSKETVIPLGITVDELTVLQRIVNPKPDKHQLTPVS
jgi:hypothetical protein